MGKNVWYMRLYKHIRSYISLALIYRNDRITHYRQDMREWFFPSMVSNQNFKMFVEYFALFFCNWKYRNSFFVARGRSCHWTTLRFKSVVADKIMQNWDYTNVQWIQITVWLIDWPCGNVCFRGFEGFNPIFSFY